MTAYKSMRLTKKLSLYYCGFALGLLTLILGIFALMHSVEGFTSHLEVKLWRRNLGDIVDQAYYLEIEDRKDERIDFLVELTQFFYNFYENTVHYKERLEDFMFRRETIRKRIDRTDMKWYKMTIVPNRHIENYVMKPQKGNTAKRLVAKKQFPFSRMLKFDKHQLQYFAEVGKRNDVYLICSARIKASAPHSSVVIRAQITEINETPDKANYVHFKIQKGTTKTMTVNRLMRLRDIHKATILVNGIAHKPIEIEKVEADCISFTDVRAIDRSKA